MAGEERASVTAKSRERESPPSTVCLEALLECGTWTGKVGDSSIMPGLPEKDDIEHSKGELDEAGEEEDEFSWWSAFASHDSNHMAGWTSSADTPASSGEQVHPWSTFPEWNQHTQIPDKTTRMYFDHAAGDGGRPGMASPEPLSCKRVSEAWTSRNEQTPLDIMSKQGRVLDKRCEAAMVQPQHPACSGDVIREKVAPKEPESEPQKVAIPAEAGWETQFVGSCVFRNDDPVRVGKLCGICGRTQCAHDEVHQQWHSLCGSCGRAPCFYGLQQICNAGANCKFCHCHGLPQFHKGRHTGRRSSARGVNGNTGFEAQLWAWTVA